MTAAMSKNNEPYLVTVNYGFDERNNSCFFHCASEGNKIEFFKTDPLVCGQIVEDRGYLQGKCDHNLRCLHFQDKVEFLETTEEKKQTFFIMIEQFEDNPEPLKQQLHNKHIRAAKIRKITVQEIC